MCKSIGLYCIPGVLLVKNLSSVIDQIKINGSCLVSFFFQILVMIFVVSVLSFFPPFDLSKGPVHNHYNYSIVCLIYCLYTNTMIFND